MKQRIETYPGVKIEHVPGSREIVIELESFMKRRGYQPVALFTTVDDDGKTVSRFTLEISEDPPAARRVVLEPKPARKRKPAGDKSEPTSSA